MKISKFNGEARVSVQYLGRHILLVDEASLHSLDSLIKLFYFQGRGVFVNSSSMPFSRSKVSHLTKYRRKLSDVNFLYELGS